MPYISAERVKEIRNQLKKEFPAAKFSVTKLHGTTVDIVILSAPIKFDLPRGYEEVHYYDFESSNYNQEQKRFLLRIREIASKGIRTVGHSEDYGNKSNFYYNIYLGDSNRHYQYIEGKKGKNTIIASAGLKVPSDIKKNTNKLTNMAKKKSPLGKALDKRKKKPAKKSIKQAAPQSENYSATRDKKQKAKPAGYRFKGLDDFAKPTKKQIAADAGKPKSKRKTYFEDRKDKSDKKPSQGFAKGGKLKKHPDAAITKDIYPPKYSVIEFIGSERNSYSHIKSFTKKSDAIEFIKEHGWKLVEENYKFESGGTTDINAHSGDSAIDIQNEMFEKGGLAAAKLGEKVSSFKTKDDRASYDVFGYDKDEFVIMVKIVGWPYSLVGNSSYKTKAAAEKIAKGKVNKYELGGTTDINAHSGDSAIDIENEMFAAGGELTRDQEIAKTILDQLGGMRRLIAMTGAHTFIAHPSGVSFKIKNPKVNYIKIILNSRDLYDIEFGRIRGDKYTVVATKEGYYDDMLKPAFEEETGMYLTFEKGGETGSDADVLDAIKDAFWELFIEEKVISVNSIISESKGAISESDRASVERFLEDKYNDSANYRRFNKTKVKGYIELYPIRNISKEKFLNQVVSKEKGNKKLEEGGPILPEDGTQADVMAEGGKITFEYDITQPRLSEFEYSKGSAATHGEQRWVNRIPKKVTNEELAFIPSEGIADKRYSKALIYGFKTLSNDQRRYIIRGLMDGQLKMYENIKTDQYVIKHNVANHEQGGPILPEDGTQADVMADGGETTANDITDLNSQIMNSYRSKEPIWKLKVYHKEYTPLFGTITKMDGTYLCSIDRKFPHVAGIFKEYGTLMAVAPQLAFYLSEMLATSLLVYPTMNNYSAYKGAKELLDSLTFGAYYEDGGEIPESLKAEIEQQKVNIEPEIEVKLETTQKVTVPNVEAAAYAENLIEFMGTNLEGKKLPNGDYVVLSFLFYPIWFYCAKDQKWYGNSDKYNSVSAMHVSNSRPTPNAEMLPLVQLFDKMNQGIQSYDLGGVLVRQLYPMSHDNAIAHQ